MTRRRADRIEELPHAMRPPHGAAAAAISRAVVEGLPPTLAGLWARSGRGMLIVTEEEAPHLELGSIYWRDVHTRAALYLPLKGDRNLLWSVIGEWLDHFAGSAGGAQRLSEGYGATPHLREAADQLAEQLAHGYAADFFQTTIAADLFARAVAAYRVDRLALSSADPLLVKWLQATIFNEGFWRKIEQEWEEPGG